MEINYDKLLDDWGEKVLAEADKAEAIKDNENFGTIKYYRSDGYANGLRMALAIFNRMEQKAKKNINTK